MILNFDDKLALLAGDSLVAAGDSMLHDHRCRIIAARDYPFLFLLFLATAH